MNGPSSPADRPRRSREPNGNPPERLGDPRGPQLPPAPGRVGDGSSRFPAGLVPSEPEPVLGSAVPVGACAWVITVSDRAHQGTYPDRSGPVLADGLRALGFEVTGPILVPDEGDQIVAALAEAVERGVELAVTTGGTGLAPRDVTPEATRRLLDRELPGLAEALRAHGVAKVPTAMLSRGLAGVAGGTLVVNLPGSTGGVRDGLAVIGSVVAHAISQIRGDTDSHAQPVDSGHERVHKGQRGT